MTMNNYYCPRCRKECDTAACDCGLVCLPLYLDDDEIEFAEASVEVEDGNER
jgi:hypothetical protein